MKIVVCIKQVPDTNEVKLDPVKGTLIRDGVPSIINPDDLAALEAALRLKDKDNSTVTVVTMGPPQAKTALIEALAMGADEAILVTDRAFGGSDTWSTSYTLAATLKKLDFDLVLAGRQAIDGDTAQVGPQIAEHLGLPSVTYAEKIEYANNTVTVHRQFEDRTHVIEIKPPCLVTVLQEVNQARYMTPGGIFEAYKNPAIKIWGKENLEPLDGDQLGLNGSPTRVSKSFTKGLKGKGTVVSLGTAESVDFLVEKLQEKFLI